MTQRFKDSGLNGLKGSIQFCADCSKPTIHYRTPDGWPICHACGYNAQLVELAAELESEQDHRMPVARKTRAA